MLKMILPALFISLLPLYNKSSSWMISSVSIFILFFQSLIYLLPPHLYPLLSINKLFLDFLSAPLIILTIWISALMIMASYSSLIKNNSPNLFLLFILILNTLLILTFSSSNIILFFIFFESTLIPTLLIILGWGYQPERLQAGFYLMIYTIMASLPLLINLLLIFSQNKSISIINPIWLQPCPNKMLMLWWISVILAFMVKMPMYTLHLWLPKAHVEAPVAGSMILAGLLLKLGSYGILRLASMFPYINKSLMPPVLSISMWGAIITSMVCIRQPDMKSLIAYSSIGHMGLLTSGTMTMTSWGWEASLLMMIAHGISSPALFALANIMYETTQTRNLFLTKGMLTMFPASTLLWFLASSANMAAPTSLNLLSEIILLSSILSSSKMMLLIVSMSVFLAAVYSLFLYTSTQHGSPSNFLNPLQMFFTRNHLTIFLHLTPLFFLCLKMDLVTNWL